MSEMRLYDTQGNRLYLSAEERTAFLAAARKRPPEERTIAETLTFTGCRISEALEITPRRVELDSGRVILRTLKKRRSDVYRAVPVPPAYLDTLKPPTASGRLRRPRNGPTRRYGTGPGNAGGRSSRRS